MRLETGVQYVSSSSAVLSSSHQLFTPLISHPDVVLTIHGPPLALDRSGTSLVPTTTCSLAVSPTRVTDGSKPKLHAY